MLKPVLTALTCGILLLSVSLAFAQAGNAQVTGSVTYRERIALPPDAIIDVQLADVSVADVAAQTVAESLINAEGRQVPVPFTLTYDPAQIVPAHHYSVRATIRAGNGMMMFSSTQAYPVLTHGAPSKVNLVLHMVGHSGKPGPSAKKQHEPSAPEGAETASATAPSTAGTTPATGGPTSATTVPPAAEPPPSNTKAPGSQPAEQAPKQKAEQSAAPPESAPEQSAKAAATAPAQSESAPAANEPPPATESSSAGQPSTQPETPAPAEAQSTAPESAVPSSPASAAAPESAPPSQASTAAAPPAAKTVEPEQPLPDSPSATKSAELAAEAPESTEAEPPPEPRPERPRPLAVTGSTPLANTQWRLVQLGGKQVVITPPQRPVTLAFSPEGTRIAGSAGCNSYLGTFTDDHGHLKLNPGGMTMMACADPAGTREQKFIAMLHSADGYKISGDYLLLTSNGKTVAKFINNPF